MGRWGGWEGGERDGDGWGGGVDRRDGREMVTDGEVGWMGGRGEMVTGGEVGWTGGMGERW